MSSNSAAEVLSALRALQKHLVDDSTSTTPNDRAEQMREAEVGNKSEDVVEPAIDNLSPKPETCPRDSPISEADVNGRFVITVEEARNLRSSVRPYALCICRHNEARTPPYESPSDHESEDNLSGTDGEGHAPRQPSATPLAITGSFKKKPIPISVKQPTWVADPKWSHEITFDASTQRTRLDVFIFGRVGTQHSGSRRAPKPQLQCLGRVLDCWLDATEHTAVDRWYRLRSLQAPEDFETGEISIRATYQPVARRDYGPSDVKILSIIGRGGLGCVFRVKKIDSQRIYAMKVVSRQELDYDERPGDDVLDPAAASVRCGTETSPFVLGLTFDFETPHDRYLVTDYVSGGDLSQHLQQEGRIGGERARFYVAELVLALEHLHQHGVFGFVFRPENVLLDAMGHIVTNDFQLARSYRHTDSRITDADYLAPELLLVEASGGHGGFTSKATQLWSLGVLIFEMCCGWSPFYAEDTQQKYKNIFLGKVRFPRDALPTEGRNLIKRLLHRNPATRLGNNGLHELMSHPFLEQIDWTALREKRVAAPRVPEINAYDYSLTESAGASPDHDTAGVSKGPDIGSVASYQTAYSRFGSASIDGTRNSLFQSLSVYGTPSSYRGMSQAGIATQTLSPSGERMTEHGSMFKTLLEARGLIEELDWSGRGQHVEFHRSDPVPLKPLAAIGFGGSAIVDSVLCRRIKLARKTMVCSRQQKLEDLLNEVEHLQRFRHAHIVQLVSTYLQGKKFAILLYPVAHGNLAEFLDVTTTELHDGSKDEAEDRIAALLGFFQCLAHTSAYIHQETTKHMDIKPQNVLIRRSLEGSSGFKVYLADFGISTHFASHDLSQTESMVARTKKYCAPEVYCWNKRGRAADVFSLGCVFLEMETVIRGKTLDDFADFRSQDSEHDGDGEDSFHANLERTYRWMDLLPDHCALATLESRFITGISQRLETIRDMLREDQDERPRAMTVLESLGGPRPCCLSSRETYVVEPTAE